MSTERGILFSAPMVRALLAGTKTQTRRVVKPLGADHIFQFRGTTAAAGADEPTGEWAWCGSPRVVTKYIRCPYGVPGDRLWCREAFQADPPIDSTWASTSWHGCPEHAQLSEIPERYRLPKHCIYRASWAGDDIARWRPSIHMPRWASRITLEITEVRVERLQSISEEDCYDEGIDPEGDDHNAGEHLAIGGSPVPAARWAYARLWERINGPESWDANPWVWAVSFRMLDAAALGKAKRDGGG